MKNKEQTLVIVKPDGVQRSLVGEVIKRYEQSGLKLVGLKFFIPTKEQVKRHYLVVKTWIETTGKKTMKAYIAKGLKPPFDDPVKIGENVLDKLQDFMSSGPVVAMIWQGNEAVGVVQKITGTTEPLTSEIGTIRGDLTVDSYALADTDERAVRNIVHASSSVGDAKKEIKIWFRKSEIVGYHLVTEAILYDVNLDGIKE